MALNDLELSVNGTSFKGVYAAITLSLASTIGGLIWGASEFMSRLETQEDAVVEATSQATAIAQRFDDLKEYNNDRLTGYEVSIQKMEQSMTAADVENLQGRLAELAANLETIMAAQQQLLGIRDRIATVEKLSSETELKVGNKLKELSTLDNRLKNLERDISDVWLALDEMYPFGG